MKSFGPIPFLKPIGHPVVNTEWSGAPGSLSGNGSLCITVFAARRAHSYGERKEKGGLI